MRKKENKKPANSANCSRAKRKKAGENLQIYFSTTHAPSQSSATQHHESKRLRQRLRNQIVVLACWGLLPIPFAEWIISCLEMKP